MSEDNWRQPIERVGVALRELHRALIRVVQADYEREHGPVGGPGALLHLLMNDPFFDWLHPMSELMVDIDALLDQTTPIDAADAAAVRVEVDRLLTATTGRAAEFAQRYLSRLQSSPHLAGDHAGLRQRLGALPDIPVENQAEMLHRRHQWAELQRRKRHRGN